MEPNTNSPNPDESPNQAMDAPESQEPTLNVEKLEDLMTRLKAKENLVFGAIGGLIAAVVGAAVWAGITLATNFQIGWMAVGVGFLCGYAVRVSGKGISEVFGYVGAVCALVGCLLGNFFTIVGYISKEESLGYGEVLTLLDYSLLPELMGATFHPMDLLFYGIALYGGYKASFHQLSEEQVNSLVD